LKTFASKKMSSRMGVIPGLGNVFQHPSVHFKRIALMGFGEGLDGNVKACALWTRDSVSPSLSQGRGEGNPTGKSDRVRVDADPKDGSRVFLRPLPGRQ
jgi:hypothetical protein